MFDSSYFVFTLQKLNQFLYRRDLETFSKAHFEECNGIEPELNRGELSIAIPSMKAFSPVY